MSKTKYSNFLKNFDAFGKHVGYAIDGEDTYKTNCGALATISIIFLVISYLAIMIAQPLTCGSGASPNSGFTPPSSNNFSEGDVGNVTIDGIDYIGTPSTRISNIHRTAAFDSKSYYPQNDGFMFAVDFTRNYQNPSRAFFEFYVYLKDNDGFFSFEYLPSIPWTPDLFPSIPNEELESYYMNEHFLCPNLTDFNFVSDNYGSTYKYISVDALTWYENITGFNWAPIDEIEWYFTGDKIRIFTVEGYHDPSDPDNPVKHKLNNEITIPISIEFQSQKDIRLKQNQVKKLDGDIVNFTSVEHKDILTFRLSSYYLAICYFELANNYDYYEMYVDYQPRNNSTRTNLNAASNEEKLMSNEYFAFYIMAQMGGLFLFFFHLFGAFVNYYNKHALNHTIINRLKSKNNEVARNGDHAKRVAPALANPTQLGNQSYNQEKSFPEERKRCPIDENNTGENLVFQRGRSPNQQNQIDVIDNPMVESESGNNEHQTTVQYTYKDLLYTVFWCNRCTKNYSDRSWAGRNAQFNKDLQKFNKDRDIVNIIILMNTIKPQIGDVKANTESIQVMHQAISNLKFNKWIDNEEKENNDFSSSKNSTKNESLKK